MATVVNGQMGSGLLVSVGGGQVLRADAAAAWLAVVAEVRARFGITLRLTDSYRPYAVQVRIFNERYDPASSGGGPFGDVRWWGGVRYVRRRGASAAVPGTSNHGLGVAVDVTGLGGFDTSDGSAYARLAAIAPAHGWSNKAGRKINEPWHWEYTPADDTHPTSAPAPAATPTTNPTVPTEDDMAALITLLYARYLGAVASIDDLVTWLDAARTNGWSAGQLHAAFLGSAASDSSVAAAYRAILHRGPESAAVIAQWRTGRTIGQAWDGIAAAYAAGSR